MFQLLFDCLKSFLILVYAYAKVTVSGMVMKEMTDAKTPNPDVSSVAMVEVFHSPRNHMRLSRLEANSMQFFYESTDEQYIKKCKENGAFEKPYWFSLNVNVAKSIAGYWEGDDGVKWRLTLRCRIPANSQVVDVYNFHSVKGESVEIVEMLWWR